jgi:hypothetical protein
MREWTSWYSVENYNDYADKLNRFGVYQIRIVDSGGNPISICRFCGIDENGFIYFGRSGFKGFRTIANRIQEFTQKRHSGGRTYARVSSIWSQNFQYKNHYLQVRGRFSPINEICEAEAKLIICEAEARLIYEYESIFGELPPCNLARPQFAE